jgi:outer membrane protein assembly factor BamE (lipoprotein component of BamABCDE complex)
MPDCLSPKAPAARGRTWPLLLLALTALVPAGCSSGPQDLWAFPLQGRGAQVDPDQVKQLVPGTSTRQDVAALLGTPTAKATFDNDTWLYISQQTRPVIAGTQGVEKQDVYVLNFNGAGVLTDVKTRTLADARQVNVVSNTTPSPGSNASFMQELLGNIGRFNAGQSLGGGGGSGGGAGP